MKTVEEVNWRHQELYKEMMAAIQRRMVVMSNEEIAAVTAQVLGGFSCFIPAEPEAQKQMACENFDLGRKAAIIRLDKLANNG